MVTKPGEEPDAKPDEPEDESEKHYDVVLTSHFLDDLEACVEYIALELGSPLAAKNMYEGIRVKVLGLTTMPKAAVSYTGPATGLTRYKANYKRYEIHYSIEGTVVRVLGLKHQLQDNKRFD